MQPHRHIERRPTRAPWHTLPDEEPSSRLTNAYARTPMAEQRITNPYDSGYHIHPEAIPEVERHRMRQQHALSRLQLERLEDNERHILENPRRGAISAGMPASARPTFPPSEYASTNPAAIAEAQRNRVREQRHAAIDSGSLVMPPPPLPSYPSPGAAAVNPGTVSGATEPSIPGRNRLRSPEHPWGPPPPPRSPEFPSFDGASSQGTANFNDDVYPTRPATFEDELERNRSRNLGLSAQGSGPHRVTRCPGPPSNLPSEFPLSYEGRSQGMADPTHASFSADIQEATDYNRGLAAQDTGTRPMHPPRPAIEQAPALSARERQLVLMNLAAQPRHRARPTSEIHESLTSTARRADESGVRIGWIPRPHQDANVAHPNHEMDTMTRSNTRRRTIPTTYETLSYDFAMPSAEQRASYLQLSNEKIEAFVHGLPVHVILDLPADSRDCAICLEKYYGPYQRECPVRLPCNHVLGKACLLTWFKSPATNRKNNACPVCRAVVLERSPNFSQMDDLSDDTISEHDISDHHEEGFTDRLAGLRAEDQILWNLERERLAMDAELERIAERLERQRNDNGRDEEHENWYRQREEEHQRELARLRREHAERMERLQGMRGERRRRRTEG